MIRGIETQAAPVICGDKIWTRAGPLALVEGEFDAGCKAYDARRLTPLLDTDVAGYAYHAILTRLDGDASCVHLDRAASPDLD